MNTTTENAGLEQVLKQAVPSCLDNIVRERRDELCLRLSTAEDLAELPPMVSIMDNQKRVKATVNDWRIVCLDQGAIGKSHVLTGVDANTDHAWGTSLVKSIDFENHLLLTENSLYRLGTKGEGEPTFNVLLHLCALFNKWGWGKRFGVPQIFY